MEKGVIRPEYIAECSCGNWEILEGENKREAAGCARRFYWKYTRKKGWLCPGCAKEAYRPETSKE